MHVAAMPLHVDAGGNAALIMAAMPLRILAAMPLYTFSPGSPLALPGCPWPQKKSLAFCPWPEKTI